MKHQVLNAFLFLKQPTVHTGRKNSSGFQSVNLTNILPFVRLTINPSPLARLG